MKKRFLFLFPITAILVSLIAIQPIQDADWADYLGGLDRNHFSPLTQINAGNVSQLKVAWTYETSEAGQMQVNPLIINGILYGVNANVQAFALNAETGKEIWKFGDSLKAWHSTSRGVSFWKSKSEAEPSRILYTVGPNLWTLDAATGKPIESFGDAGKVDLHTGLSENAKDKFIISNTPGTIFEDLIVMPVRLAEDGSAAPGDVRAFNVKTGKLAWTFHTIPYPGEFGFETFPKDAHKNTNIGAANNWAGMALDAKRGILYVPTGSASPDFYGGNRLGKNLFANCLLALDARTGKRLWHFQTTHHDIWDRDLPAPPNLITLKHKGKMVDAVAQVTKQGLVFVFDRVTGKSLFPINEIPAQISDLEGEIAWKTQPVPSLPEPFARQSTEITANDLSPFAENKAELLETLNKTNTKRFAAPNKTGTLVFPGYDGGAEWGGAAVDPAGIMYVNANEMAWILKMKENPKKEAIALMPLGEKTYNSYCVSCHGSDRKGNAASGYPNLVNIASKSNREQILSIISNGKGMMPGFTMISAQARHDLVSFLLNEEKKEVAAKETEKNEYYSPYSMTGYNKFLDSKGLPAISPPWGTLNAIDLNTGQFLWKIPFGEEASLKAKGIPTTGTENYGGPIITASGLLFIAATKDAKFRVFETKTGKLLWETKLPAAGFATPSTYSVNGKQYVVIACGGTKLGTTKGNKYVAFSL